MLKHENEDEPHSPFSKFPFSLTLFAHPIPFPRFIVNTTFTYPINRCHPLYIYIFLPILSPYLKSFSFPPQNCPIIYDVIRITQLFYSSRKSKKT